MTAPSDDDAPLLEMHDISKAFPGVQALRGVELTVHPGEVVALIGENGAGKSTLIRIAAGVHVPDSGRLRIAGRDTTLETPAESLAAGVAVIHQELQLVPAQTAAENIFLGREPATLGFVRRAEENRRARELFERIGVDIDPAAACRTLTIAEQQIVEIAKALSQEARVFIMDEPTAALTPREVERLFAVIRDLRARGLGIVYISHRLEEIETIADRAVVLRDGALVGERSASEFRRSELIELMVGRELESEFPRRSVTIGETRLEVEGLCRGERVRNVSLKIRRGEILALAGLVGAGRTETARLIFGADGAEAGRIRLDGRKLRIRSPRDAIAAGICLLAEDRKSHGLVLGLPAQSNFTLPNLGRLSRWGFVRAGAEREAFTSYASRLRLRTQPGGRPVRELSGGNQQKVVLAKWLESRAEVFLFDEPTRGIDVGAKYEIYGLMNELAAQGKAILMISSELPEILGMADRILVLDQGRLRGEITDVANATQEQVLHMAVGARHGSIRPTPASGAGPERLENP